MTTTSKFVRMAASASLIALGAASIATAQPLANPVVPANPDATAPRTRGDLPSNFLRPRVGIQAAVTDNVTSVATDPQSDVIGRLTVGGDARFDGPRFKGNASGDLLYEVYSKNSKFDTLNYRGTADASFVVVPDILAIEAAGGRTQGSLSTFGTTEFFRTANANDFQVGTYYVGPHLSISPGIFDISAAARYGQVFFDAPKASTIQGLDPETSIYQVIGAVDTSDNLGKLRLVTSGQYQQDDGTFKSTAGSMSGFYQVTPRFTSIVRAGYDDLQLTGAIDLQAPFWSVGGQYVFNERANIRLEGGQRYKEAYFSGNASINFARNLYLIADYNNTLSPGPIAINNVLVDYVGGLDKPLPGPITPPSFQLGTNFYNQASINRVGSARLFADFTRHSLDYTVMAVQQKLVVASFENRTISQSVTYTNRPREDLSLSLRFLYASERLNGQLAGTGDRNGSYYLTTARADYQLNRRTALILMYQNRHFRPAAVTLLQAYDENIGSIALTRSF